MSALNKISGRMDVVPVEAKAKIEGANAFFIIPALSGNTIMELFSTHPPLEKRIANLEKVEAELEATGYLVPEVTAWQAKLGTAARRPGPVRLPEGIPADRMIFRSVRAISGGVTPPMRYLLYIDPERYGAIDSPEVKKSLGRIVGRINGTVMWRVICQPLAPSTVAAS